MIPDYKSIVTGGGTQVEGELRVWQDIAENNEGFRFFSDKKTKGIYAIAISPTGKYLASGSKIGLVRIWPFLEHELHEKAPFIFEIYHQLGPVTALVFLTDDLILSGGFNGLIRVSSISQGKPLKDIEAHSGPICSLLTLGSRVVVSLGMDGLLKIWDMDSLTCEFKKEDIFFPRDKFGLFPSLAFSEEAGLLYAPSVDGKLNIFNLRNSCSHKQIQVHQNIFYAMTVCGNYLLTGGMTDQKLKLWDVRTDKLEREIEVGAGFLRLSSVGKSKATAICHEANGSQSLRLFEIPELRQSENVHGLNLRSTATIPLSAFLYRENFALNQLKDNLVNQAKAKLVDLEGLKPVLKQLTDKGFWVEANLLQADSAKLRHKALDELEVLLQLTKKIGVSRRTAAVFHRLALLLAQLDEPELAITYLEKVNTYYDGVDEEIQKLKAHPLYNLDRDKTIRSDFSALEVVIQEMKKDTVLRRPFRWRLIIPSRKSQFFMIKTFHDLDLWEKRLQEGSSNMRITIKMEQEDVKFFDGLTIRELRWINISRIGVRYPSPLLDYALEIDQENGRAKGYGIFNPNKMDGPIDNVVTHNATLSQNYQSIHQLREVGNWLIEVHDKLVELDGDSSFFTRS